MARVAESEADKIRGDLILIQKNKSYLIEVKSQAKINST